jgi:hypothetical protein
MRERYVQTTFCMLKKIFESQNRSSDLLTKAESDYRFQPELTASLDEKVDDFDEMTILKIVLWKTNRYPELNANTIQVINDLRNAYSQDKARTALPIS